MNKILNEVSRFLSIVDFNYNVSYQQTEIIKLIFLWESYRNFKIALLEWQFPVWIYQRERQNFWKIVTHFEDQRKYVSIKLHLQRNLNGTRK